MLQKRVSSRKKTVPGETSLGTGGEKRGLTSVTQKKGGCMGNRGYAAKGALPVVRERLDGTTSEAEAARVLCGRTGIRGVGCFLEKSPP